MTSNGSRFQDESFTITAKSPHFYHIILESTNPQDKLEIPSKFVEKYGDCLSSPVKLRVPSGASWKVELSKNGDDIWLEKGWQEFSGYHNLKHGHLLVFQYKGENHFHVFIFDMSAVEIQYKDNETEDAISCQILDDLTSVDGVEEVEESLCPIQGELKVSIDKKSRSRKGSRTSCSNTCGALGAANNFISNYPHFKVVFKHQIKRTVSIPFSFIQGNIEYKSQTLMLQVEDKSWPVKLNVYSYYRSARLSSGWSVFARENSLKPRDVCIFELIKSNVLNVSIFKYGG